MSYLITQDALNKETKRADHGTKKKTTKIHFNLTEGITKKIKKIKGEEMTQANLSVLVGIQPMHETMINLKEA
jgi:hypothetical protein